MHPTDDVQKKLDFVQEMIRQHRVKTQTTNGHNFLKYVKLFIYYLFYLIFLFLPPKFLNFDNDLATSFLLQYIFFGLQALKSI